MSPGKNPLFRISSILLIIISVTCLFTGCKTETLKEYTSVDDFKHATIGSIAGALVEKVTYDEFPDAKVLRYSSLKDVVIALQTGKIDGFMLDDLFYKGISWEQEGLTIIDTDFGQLRYGFAFKKNDKGAALKKQVDEFILSLKNSGELETIQNKWFADEKPKENVDFSILTGENGTIKVAAGSDNIPFIYRQNSKFTGYEIDLLVQFCKAYGYNIDIKEESFNGTLMGVKTERYDIAAFGINISDEREEEILYSSETAVGNISIITRKTSNKKSIDDIKNGTIGAMTGSVYNKIAPEAFPDATIKFYSTPADVILAVEQGRIDAYIEDDIYYHGISWDKDNLSYIETDVNRYEIAIALSKKSDPQLKAQINEFITKCLEDGTIDRLSDKWFSDEEPEEHPDYENLPAINGSIKMAVDPMSKPIVYKKNDKCSGFDIEFMTIFAREYGYALDITEISFESIITGLSTGKFDLSANGITITEERKESTEFSLPYFSGNAVLIINDEDEKPQTIGTFFTELKESFEKTFIREDRWKLIAQGILVTMFISICSIIGGTVVGFAMFVLCRSKNKIISKLFIRIGKIHSRIISGTPLVVILMILYYVVFGYSKTIDGITVAIIGFTISFASFVYEHMEVSVDSINQGQREAAYALGYTRGKAFKRIIFPQAAAFFLPSYIGQSVDLIKATAVVGYIAVNDLTKMGDIIRSNTYEAFFPLLATAVIYFLLTWLMAVLLRLLQKHFNPQRRGKRKILKGVNEYDQN